MTRLRAAVAFVVLLAPVVIRGQSQSGTSGPARWRFVDPNAKAAISINWQRIRQSPAGAMIRDKWLNAGLGGAVPLGGLLDQVERVMISSPGNAAVQDPGIGTDVESVESPLLIAVEGHFQAAGVREFFKRLGAKPQSYTSFQVYRPQGADSKDMAYVLFDAGTILFGDAPSVFAALERSRFPAPLPEPGSILARGAELDAMYDAWLVITSPSILSNDRLAGLFHEDEWAPDAQGFEAGVQLRSGLAADVTVRFASEAAAKGMVTGIARVTAIAAKDKGAPQMQDITRKLKFSSEGSATKITLRLTPQEFEKSAQAFAAAHKTPVAAEKAVAPPPVIQAPVKPGVIRIEGLDDGPREIPFPDHQN